MSANRAPDPTRDPVGSRTVPGAQEKSVSAPGSHRVDFARPPVAETILSVQFVELRELSIAHFGLFWADVRSRYPRHEVKPPLTPIVEDFSGLPGPESGFGIQFGNEPDARCWFIDETSTQLIQVQRDRFIRNWRKQHLDDEEYPRYDALRPRFADDWARFVAFLEREGLGRPDVNQCEVTYINHIERGLGWDSLGEAHKVFSILRTHREPREILPDPEAIVFNARYVMPRHRGRLHVAAQPAVRRIDGKQILQLTLTARGKPDSSSPEDILAWFDEGHDWIVHGFVDVTTPAMHEIWGRL